MNMNIRLVCRYYSALLLWPLRHFWRWSLLLKPGEFRDTLQLKIATDPDASSNAARAVKLKLTDQDALQIWKHAYVATKDNCDFIQVGKKAYWQNSDDQPILIDDTVLRIGRDYMIIVGYVDGEVWAKSVRESYLDLLFDHFGLPNFQ